MNELGKSMNSQFPVILFAVPPPLDKLHAIKIFMWGAKCSAGKMQPQVVKCREFIFTEPNVIGTPSPDLSDQSFHLIAQTSAMYPVSTELYQSCLRYTIQARLSPSWNKVGQWFLQGRDFLTHKGCANAVKMDVTFVHNELFFTLEAAVFKLTPLHVTDLDITAKQLENFISNPHAQINYEHILSDWCYVLPSMKRGRIVTISHEIPEESPFRTYRDLKRHWKNMYGYRLPDNEEDVNFYQVHFGPLGGRLFTYPEVCLRGRELQKMARIDPKPILRTFIQDFQSRFPIVCGCPIKLQSKAKFTVSKLYSGSQDSTDNQLNITTKMSGARPSLYKTKSEMDTLFMSNDKIEEKKASVSSSGKSQSKVIPSESERASVNYTTNHSTNSELSIPGNSNELNDKKQNKSCETPCGVGQSHRHTLTSGILDTNKTQPNAARKLFPHFESTKRHTHAESKSINDNKSATKIVPLFHPKNKNMFIKPSAIPKSKPKMGLMDSSKNLVQIDGLARSNNCVVPSFQKPSLNSSHAAKLQKMGVGKKKSKKRSAETIRDGKQDVSIESKKMKKMRKAEA